MSRESVTAQVAELHLGDHVCWTYDDDAEHASVLQAFFAAGLPAGERLLYFGTAAEVHELIDGLRTAQHDPDELIRTERLIVGDAMQAYLPDGTFDAEARTDGFREVAGKAISDGYAGVRVAGENTGIVNHPATVDSWLDYELRIELLTSTEPILGMCCFDRRECHDKALATLDAVHRVPLDPDSESRALPFRVHGRADGRLALSGEVDALSAAELRKMLDGPAGHLDPMVIDVTGLDFIDSAGIRVLERLSRGRAADRGPLQVENASDFLRSVWTFMRPVASATLVLKA